MIAEVLAWPTRGPQWISDRLAQAGLTVAPVTAWRVLRRHGLNHRLARLAVLEEQSAVTGLLAERTARRRRGRPVVAAQPGELCAPSTFYVGKLKGVGKVWQLTACDCASSYSCGWWSARSLRRSWPPFWSTSCGPAIARLGGHCAGC